MQARSASCERTLVAGRARAHILGTGISVDWDQLRQATADSEADQHRSPGSPSGAADLGWDHHGGDRQPDSPSSTGQPEQLAAHELVRLLPCRRELHLALNPTWSSGVHRRDSQRFLFVGVREVCFQDSSVPVGWCSHPACCNAGLADIVSGTDFQQENSAAFLASQQPLCPVAAKLLVALGGWQGQRLWCLRQYSYPLDPMQHLVVPITWQGEDAKAVLLDSLKFSSYSVLLQHADGGSWMCRSSTCASPHTCGHMAQAGLASKDEACTLSEEAFEARLAEDFDTITGTHSCTALHAIRSCTSTSAPWPYGRMPAPGYSRHSGCLRSALRDANCGRRPAQAQVPIKTAAPRRHQLR